ncbi:transcription initiation factor IIB [Candidatus Geothermarchaeota archaeon]|nr:MAG: transcription initiation factor IIB [Candidatus Geothermarchaeota archaeon]
MSTLIGTENEDSMGRKITARMKGDVNRLRKWQRRISIYGSIERNLIHALNELNKLGEKLDLPRDILERASYIYRMALEKDLVRGRAIDTIIAAALYAALRYYRIPRTLREVAQASGRSKKDLARCYRMLIRNLDLRMPLANPLQYVRRICASAGLDKKVMLEAEKIIKLAQKRRLTAGKDPVGLAAAAVYYACVLLNVKKTQRDIAIAANITEVTVRNRYKSLSEHLKLKEPVKMELLQE